MSTLKQRPDSSQIADLHIYILPINYWKDSQNLAFNEAIKESVSLGFIRVNRELKVSDLRDEIRRQCQPNDVPKDFIFLKSVGRALTRVRSKQEQELKVKNFLPPQTHMPEIFILEGRHEDYRSSPHTFRRVTEIEHHVYAEPPLMYPPTESPFIFRNVDQQVSMEELANELEGNTMSNRASKLKNPSKKSLQIMDPDAEKLRDITALREEQERLRQRQAELELMRNRQLELEQLRNQQLGKSSNSRLENYDDQDDNNKQDVAGNTERETREHDQHHQQQELEKQKQREQKEREQREREQREKEKRDRSRERREREMYEDSAIKIQSYLRGYQDRQKFKSSDQNGNAETVESLRAKLEETRRKRSEVEMLRSELIRNLKLLHNRITVRRKEARDLWKKKYFSEKKKTPALEEKIQLQLSEIDSLQKKIFNNLETDIRNAALGGYIQESEQRNNLLISLKLQEEIYSYKRQVDQAKLKLTTDIKLRNQAETESKALRTELIQTKMNLHQLKNH